ncbi:hypothetical protein [Chryseobacterium binzhouense]|uniref:hypothetical protein n=1 Tax=Chryseobacterium binzhouense TaxID=2593646 RepID=UPI00117C60FB|nr:hypothetical protein [Chryseobacterium binzhouense]MXS70812.1 hypothetical protein [Flavobacteriaceae bacterium W22]
MKKFYKSKNLLRLSFLAVLLLSVVTVFNSCKDDDEDQFQDHLVQFEAKIVPGGTTPPTPPIELFKTVVTQVGTKQETIFAPKGLTWTSGDFFVNSSQSQLNFSANATLLHPDATLTVTIYVDGEVAKTATVTGTGEKSAAVAHSFLEL